MNIRTEHNVEWTTSLIYNTSCKDDGNKEISADVAFLQFSEHASNRISMHPRILPSWATPRDSRYFRTRRHVPSAVATPLSCPPASSRPCATCIRRAYRCARSARRARLARSLIYIHVGADARVTVRDAAVQSVKTLALLSLLRICRVTAAGVLHALIFDAAGILMLLAYRDTDTSTPIHARSVI